jgi:hypothetical protein
MYENNSKNKNDIYKFSPCLKSLLSENWFVFLILFFFIDFLFLVSVSLPTSLLNLKLKKEINNWLVERKEFDWHAIFNEITSSTTVRYLGFVLASISYFTFF